MYERPAKPAVPPRQGRTPRQLRRHKERRAAIIEALELYWTEHDRGPSRQELGAAVGLRAESLKSYLDELRADGVVIWDDEPRSLRMAN